jgi:hypothetical protein
MLSAPLQRSKVSFARAGSGLPPSVGNLTDLCRLLYQEKTMTVRDELGEFIRRSRKEKYVDEKPVIEKLGVENVATNPQGIPPHDYIVVIAVAQSCTGFAR